MLGRAVAWSLGVHAVALGGLAWLLATPPALRAVAAWSAAAATVTSDARADADADARDVRDERTLATVELRAPGEVALDVPAPGAPTPAANPDAHAGAAARSSGHGDGAPTVVTARADEATLRVQPYDAPRGYAMQRIATSPSRRESREQVRATPHPAATPWLSSSAGTGHAREHAIARADVDADKALRAPAGFARPDVQANPAATDAAKPSDDVADRVDQALVSDEKQPAKLELTRPTSPGAATSGQGDGALGYAPTAQGRAPVPTGAPRLPDARELALATFQRTYDRYLSRVRQKVDPLWEFPRELAVRMEQGDVLVGFTIRKDGSVADVRVLKGSGFDKFDKNVLAAIKKAAPFDPLPETLGASLRVTAPFEGSNPAIR